MGWYNASWDYRVKITVDNTQVDADLTDFPVYVDLSDLPAGFFTNVKSDGGDIRVTKTDGTTEVPREVVAISTGSSTGELHFKADGTLSSSADTDYYIYYGNAGASEPAASATYGRNNVWTDYYSVHHLQEDPSGSAPQMLDSTGSYDGTSAGSMNSGDSVTAQIGKGLDFGGTDDNISLGANIGVRGTHSVTAWADIAAASGTGTVIGEYNSSGSQRSWVFYKPNSTTGEMRVLLSSTGSSIQKFYDSSVTPFDGTSNHVAYTFNATSPGTLKLFMNGTEDTSVTKTTDSTITSLFNSNQDVRIGAHGTGTSFPTTGIIDEVRVRNGELSSTWISTEYNNQNSPGTFYTSGSQETAPASTAQPAIFFGMNF